MNYSNCGAGLGGWWLVCDVPIKTPSARDLISGTAGTRTRAREYSQHDKIITAGNESPRRFHNHGEGLYYGLHPVEIAY